MTGEGYRYGAVVDDAALFVPQSRERVFIIAVADDVHIPAELLTDKPRLGQLTPFHPSPVVALLDPLPDPRFDLRGRREPRVVRGDFLVVHAVLPNRSPALNSRLIGKINGNFRRFGSLFRF